MYVRVCLCVRSNRLVLICWYIVRFRQNRQTGILRDNKRAQKKRNRLSEPWPLSIYPNIQLSLFSLSLFPLFPFSLSPCSLCYRKFPAELPQIQKKRKNWNTIPPIFPNTLFLRWLFPPSVHNHMRQFNIWVNSQTDWFCMGSSNTISRTIAQKHGAVNGSRACRHPAK